MGAPVLDEMAFEGVGSAQRYSYRWPADMVGQAVGEQNSVTVLYSIFTWLKKSTATRVSWFRERGHTVDGEPFT